jgi:formylglycine-generating enzyme required for sulfatase activity
VRVETDPPGAALTLARYREDASGRLVEADRAPLAAGGPRELEPGSYLIVAEAPGRYGTRYPFLVRRGEERALRVVLPPAADVPGGMVYVPAGRSLYGSGDDEDTRGFLAHQPVHDTEVGAFFIARNEVTNGDYLAFLGALEDRPTRNARIPAGLARMKDGRILPRVGAKTFSPGEPYCNGGQPCVDPVRLPVDGASREDGEHFTEWLSRSGRVPGARLCTDREWERAARGADDRPYPNGNGDLAPDDACTLATYGGNALVAGPCAVGTHPASRSPFGVDDMTGNEWEWTSRPADVAAPKLGVTRGAGFDDYGMYLSLTNRGVLSVSSRYLRFGLRVCANAK